MGNLCQGERLDKGRRGMGPIRGRGMGPIRGRGMGRTSGVMLMGRGM